MPKLYHGENGVKYYRIRGAEGGGRVYLADSELGQQKRRPRTRAKKHVCKLEKNRILNNKRRDILDVMANSHKIDDRIAHYNLNHV